MINTTIDQKGISLSDKELTDLNRGGRMWEEGDLFFSCTIYIIHFPCSDIIRNSLNIRCRGYNFQEQIWIVVRPVELMEGALRGSAYRKERIWRDVVTCLLFDIT
jgi:hypothetical protein